MYNFCSICAGKLTKKNGHLACVKCPFVNYQNPRPTVSGLIMYRDKILFTRRGRDPYKGWWDFPGGFMDWGEHPEETLRREIKEETGLEILVKRIVGIYPGYYPAAFDPVHILSIAYYAVAKTNKITPADDAEEGRWFPLSKLPKRIAFNNHKRILFDFKKVLWSAPDIG